MSGHFLPHLRPRVIALWHRVKGPARLALLALVVWKLGSALNAIGWGKLVHNLPAKPWFYAIFIINYLSLPFFEMIIYHWLWRTGPSVLPALLRKRVYNETVLEYSGETALFVWASNHTHVAEGKIFRDVRDVNILSAFVSNLATFLLLVAVFAGVADQLSGADALMLRHGVMLSGGIALVLVVLAVAFRRRFLALTLGKVAGVTALHSLRMISWMGLQVLQWHVAVPQLAYGTWLIFLALQMGVSRVPLIPVKDLFFIGLAIKLGGRITLAPAMIAGLFVASSGLNLIANGSMYVLGQLMGLKRSDAANRLKLN